MSLSATVKQSASANAEQRVISLAARLDQMRQAQTVEHLAQAMVPILRDLAEMPEALAGHLLPIAESLDRLGAQTAKTLATTAQGAHTQAEAVRDLLGDARKALQEQRQMLAAAQKALNVDREAWKVAMQDATVRQTRLLWIVLAVSALSPLVTMLLWGPMNTALGWIGLLA